MLPRRISSRLLGIISALALLGVFGLNNPLHAQNLPLAPSSVFSAGAPAQSRILPGPTFFGTPSLFLTTPSIDHSSLFLTPVHPMSPLLFSDVPSRPTGADRFALFNEVPATNSSSFVLAGFNLSAGLAHGRQSGGTPLNGFSLSTKASGMDFSLSGGLTGGGFNMGGFAPTGDHSVTGVAPSGSPQLSLRLKF